MAGRRKTQAMVQYVDLDINREERLAREALLQLESRNAMRLVRQLIALGFKGEIESRDTGTIITFLPEDEMEDFCKTLDELNPQK